MRSIYRRVISFLPLLFVNLLTLSISSSAFADDPKEPDPKEFQFHGFLSQGAVKTTSNNYLVDKSVMGSLDYTEAGLNFTKQLTDNLRTGAQLFVQRLGSTEDLNAKLDWAYLDYHGSDWLGLRLGRVKLPFGLYNDIVDIDAGRAPILLPQSVYPEQSRNYFLAQDGVELYGYSGSGPGGAFDYRIYGGTIPIVLNNTPGSAAQVEKFYSPFLIGARLFWETPVDGLRVGSSFQTMRFDTSILVGSTTVSGEIPATFWLSSIEYNHNDLLLAAEYERSYILFGSSTNPSLFPNTNILSEGGYAMGAYRVSKWLQPAMYYSASFPNLSSTTGRQGQQHDISATLRFDINSYWLVKVEGHCMLGTAGLDPTLNGATPQSALSSPWGLFLIKTTAYY